MSFPHTGSRNPGSGPWVFRTYGFTILEVLVVMVILSVLSMLLFAVWSRVRTISRHTQCMVHLRVLHQVAMSYTSDRGGVLPDLVYWKDEREKFSNWSLLPYLEYDPSALACPVTEADSRFKPVTDRPWDGTYGINVFMVGSNQSGGSIANWDEWKDKNPIAWTLSSIGRPEVAPLFMDGAGIKDSYGARYSVFTNQTRAGTDPGEGLGSQWATPYLHPGKRINIVYVDGHVDSLQQREVLEMNWSGE